MSKILVAVDFSSLTRRTVEYAVRYARATEQQIDLVHVTLAALPAHVRAHASKEMLDKIEASEESGARQSLQAAMDTHVPEGLRGDLLLRRGKAADEICSAAAEGYDLLVVSTNGRTGFQHMLMGSVAEKVVRFSPVPVLVVR